eukprot:gene9088-10766_t
MENPEIDSSNICFRSEEWLQAYVGGVLSREAVLEYFKLSPFYDHDCLNELENRQKFGAEGLSAIGKFEYAIHPKLIEPHLYIVCKQQREADSTKLLATYYILDGTIYQAPSMYAILNARTVRSISSMRKAFRMLGDALDPTARAAKQMRKTTGSTSKGHKQHGEQDRQRTLQEEVLIDRIIMGVLSTPMEEKGPQQGVEEPAPPEQDEAEKTTVVDTQPTLERKH